ncbi:glycosyltransferase [Micromonospora sonneratiae]|uniref:Glycosyltransferase n=1 Tax=Micromonospora sonneratiae TaxID=1184706 RepID=A0ABW3Y6H7_9ACTN
MALVLMVIHGTDGDVLPFVRVGRALRARGHDVTVLSHEYYRPVVDAAGIGFVPIDTISEYEYYLADAGDQADATEIGEFRHHFDRTGLFAQLRFECRELLRRHRPGHTVLVGAPISGQSALIAAEATGAPLVCLAHSPFQFQALSRVGWLYGEVLADRIDAARAEVGLAGVRDWPGWMWSADRYVGLWPDWFDRAGTPAPAGVQLAGFVLADDGQHEEHAVPPEAAELLAGAVPPLLITGGTGRLLHREFYRTAVEAVRLLDRPALLAVRHRELVPDPLPPNVRWFPRLPFPAVAPRVAAVVHHGGIGTLARALTSNTGQVILASGLDRPDNAGRVARHGAANWLPEERWTPREVADAIRATLAAPRPAHDAGPDGTEGAADAIEATLPAG